MSDARRPLPLSAALRVAVAAWALAWAAHAGGGRPAPLPAEAATAEVQDATPAPAADGVHTPRRAARPVALPPRVRAQFPFAPGGDDLLAVADAAIVHVTLTADADTAQPPGTTPLLAPGEHLWAPPGGAARWVQVPWPVQPDSVANLLQAQRAGSAPVSPRGLGLAPLDPREAEGPPVLQAAADLLRDGRLASFVLVPVPGDAAVAYVVEPDRQGRWHDRSAAVLGDAEARRFCERPWRVLVADFNGDGRPDLFIACEGDRQWLLASRPRGPLARIAVPLAVPATLEAADADGDGHVDLVDAGGWWLPGRGDGRFGAADAAATASGSR